MKSSYIKIIILIAIIGIPASIITYLYLKDNQPLTGNEVVKNSYTDGSYSAIGSYISPGGKEEVSVSLTLKDNIIIAVDYSASSTDPISTKLQQVFGENYKPLVIGKNIDELNITKVSGSSLTPKGFNDAIEKIKVEARS